MFRRHITNLCLLYSIANDSTISVEVVNGVTLIKIRK